MFAKWERYLYLILFIAAVTFFIGPFFPPLMLGVILSIAVYPIYQKILKKKSEKLRVFVSTVLLTLLIIVPIILLITFGSIKGKEYLGQVTEKSMDSYITQSYEFLNNKKLSNYLLSTANLDEAKFKTVVNSNVEKVKGKVLHKAQGVASSIPFALFGFILVIATVYFGLLDGKKTRNLFIHNRFYDEKFGTFIVNEFVQVSRGVIVSTIGCAAVQSLLICIPVLIFDTNLVLPVLFFSFFLSMIPLIGTTPTFIFLLITNFMQGDVAAIITYLAFALIVGSVDNVIRALILKRSNKIHPFIGFMSAIGGIQAMGFFGIFLGPVIVIMTMQAFNYIAFQKKVSDNK